MSPVPVIKAAINHADKDEIIIMDSPPGTSCPFIQTASKADYIVLVTEPTPFGLSDLKQSVYTLQNMDKPFGVIINRAGLGNRDVYKWLEEENIDLIMELPFNVNIAKIYSEGKLITDELPDFKTEFFDLTNKINDVIKNK
jgi:MinD superfamily P-loop ATPase